MIFQWDKTNVRKHGLSFEDALHVFSDPLAITRPDFHENEERWQVIGNIAGLQIVLIVHTIDQLDDDVVIRIIPARKATRQERRQYENGTWVS